MNLILLILFSVPLYMLFRHGPNIPDLHFSECFVAMVYITNMLLIYSIFFSLLIPTETGDDIFYALAIPLIIIPIKQLTGYSYWSTIWRTIMAFIPFCIVVLLLLIAIIVTYVICFILFG